MLQLTQTIGLIVTFHSLCFRPYHNISLPCRAPTNNKQILAVQWSRADLKQEYVLLYRDEVFVPDNQHPAFENRVDLQDRQMKDGDVSLILKNVTINDTGTYECHVFRRGTNHRIRTISLSVVPPCESLKGRFCGISRSWLKTGEGIFSSTLAGFPCEPQNTESALLRGNAHTS
uniref:Ig-like domain-containing protein n=1 Tax=Oreochromis aureus TaxID=47969 RepID=A0AAZ1XNJ8_OREAU